MKRKLIIPSILAFAFLSLAVSGGALVYAQDSTYPSIVQKLAERFNLSESEVAQVFEEEREERHAEMYASFEASLGDLVADGKITLEQKQSILDKHEDIHERMRELMGANREENREKIRALHEELKDWSQEQGLDLKVLGLSGGKFGYGGMHKFRY